MVDAVGLALLLAAFLACAVAVAGVLLAHSKRPWCAHGACLRCLRPWCRVAPHLTWYTFGQGCFPLCEECWRLLRVDERIPFYEELVDQWHECNPGPDYEERLRAVLEAVRAGR